MDDRLNILIIEDKPSDVELEMQILERSGIKAEHRVVEDEESFLSAVEKDMPDIIISDYVLPSFDGIRALELVRERGIQCPFIIVTGSVGEEVAVQCLKAGAWDYVLKDHLVRLPSAVRSGIEKRKRDLEREEERKNNIKQLEYVKELQAAVVSIAKHSAVSSGDLTAFAPFLTETAGNALNVSRVGLWVLEPGGEQIRCVDLYQKDIGRHSEGDVLYLENYPAYFEALKVGRVIESEDVYNDPRTLEFKQTYLEPFGIRSLLDAVVRVSGEAAGVLCLEQTGTSRRWLMDEVLFAGEVADQVAQAFMNRQKKQREEEIRLKEEYYRNIFDDITDSLFVFDLDGRLVDVNRTACAVYGYRKEDLIGRKPLDLKPEGSGFGYDRVVEKIRATGKYSGEGIDVRKDGRRIHTEVRGVKLRYHDVERVLVVVRDVSERVLADRELKKAFSELKMFKDLTVGRENRMVELKKEVNGLARELGREPVYDVSFRDLRHSGEYGEEGV
jgi:PAS domain S-box-containing protein